MEFKEKEIVLKDGNICVLRSPNEQDAVAILELLKITAGETSYLIRYPEEVTMTLEEEQKFLKNILESKLNLMICAFVNGELAGNAGIHCVREHLKVKHRARFGIGIKQKFWNKGIGNALMKELLNAAKEMGFEQLELEVFSGNTRAISLYKKYGFEVWGTVKNACKLKDGTYFDELVMGRFL